QMASQLYNNISLKIGIHCCANTDWSILTSVKELDIISFDAYEYFETFLLYKEDIKQFINRGGTLAWGIIPNNEKVFDTDYSNLAFCFLPKEKQELVEKIKQFSSVIFKSILNSSTEKCSIINVVLNTGIVTPQCGLGTTSIDVAEKVLEVCRKYSDMVV
ncbi:MAG: hypothetical protein NZ839_04645, partial [Endomicrobia bacterium]|nr:hypothetical protein [Endomicrobiia bacterium]